MEIVISTGLIEVSRGIKFGMGDNAVNADKPIRSWSRPESRFPSILFCFLNATIRPPIDRNTPTRLHHWQPASIAFVR